MKFEDSTEGLTQRFQDNLVKSYKRKRQKRNIDGEPNENVRLDAMDMDIASNDEDSPESPPIEFSHPKPALDESNSTVLDTSCDSNRLSLTELQRKQEELLKALADAEHSDDPETNSSPASPDELQDQSIHENGNTTRTTTTTTTTTLIVQDQDLNETAMTDIQNMPQPSCSTPTTPQGHSKSALSGTPLIKHISPFSRLPCGDKWSAGVTDVIDFENLPDATGTYQKLGDVLRRVRTFVKESNDEIDES